MSVHNFTSVVGVVGDVKRDFENDYVANKCCVYGIDREEHMALKVNGLNSDLI